MLAAHAERLATGGENGDPGGAPDRLCHERGHRTDEVLAVVEDEQQAFVLEVLLQAHRDRHDRRRAVAHRGGHGVLEVVRIVDRRELAEPHSVGMIGCDGCANLEGESRLPHATHSGDRHQARLEQPRFDVGQLVFAPDEAAELVGQVGGVDIDRTKRRVYRRCTGDLDLEEVHRALEITKSVITEVDEVEVVAHELFDDARAHHLAAVGDRHHAGGAVHLGAVPVAVTLGGLAGMDAHPHAELDAVTPVGVGERLLPVDGSAHRVAG